MVLGKKPHGTGLLGSRHKQAQHDDAVVSVTVSGRARWRREDGERRAKSVPEVQSSWIMLVTLWNERRVEGKVVRARRRKAACILATVVQTSLGLRNSMHDNYVKPSRGLDR